MATVKEFTRNDLPPQTHAYDAPGLGPLQFLRAVMHATHLPMASRIQAASALLPFTHPVPRPTNSFPRCTIVIGGLGPYDQGLSPEGPEQINGISQSISSSASNRPLAQSGDTPVLNIETTSNPPYSEPPSPEDIQQITKAVHALRPDLAHLPIPEFHLCPCGHWITGSYPCCETRYKNWMN
jgi:hypothetical protein